MLNALTRRSFHFGDLDPKALQSEIFLFRIRALSGGCRKAVVEDLHCCYACHSTTYPRAHRAHVSGGGGALALREPDG